VNTINIRDLGKWPRQTVGKYVSAMTKEIQVSLKMCGPAIVQTIIDGTRPFPPVNTGEYRRNWKVRNIPGGAVLFNPTLQAGIIERGRRPGIGVSRKGQEDLARWVHLHGMDAAGPLTSRQRATRRRMRKAGVDKRGIRMRQMWSQENRARGIAFLIARAIKRRGLPAKNILGRAKPIIVMQVVRDVEAIMVKGVA
jgi:hypothetical protein